MEGKKDGAVLGAGIVGVTTGRIDMDGHFDLPFLRRPFQILREHHPTSQFQRYKGKTGIHCYRNMTICVSERRTRLNQMRSGLISTTRWQDERWLRFISIVFTHWKELEKVPQLMDMNPTYSQGQSIKTKIPKYTHVPGPAFAILRIPRPVCLSLKFSSLNVSP